MNTLLRSAACVALLVALACCKSMSEGTKDRMSPLVGDWTLAWMHARGSIAPPRDDAARGPSVTFAEGGQITGFAGVNRYSGKLDAAALRDGHFATGPLAATRMAGPPEAMELDEQFLGLLDRANRYRVDGATLVFSDESGELLRFTRLR